MPPPHQHNPFVLPGMVNPHQALEPHPDRPVEDDYVGVDRTDEAYEDFVSEAVEASLFAARGGFVVVTGDTQTGKTSVLNRCVHWVESGLREAPENPGGVKVSPFRVDLRSGPGKRLDVEDLAKWVTQRLLERLEGADLIDGAGMDRLSRRDAMGRLDGVSQWQGMRVDNRSDDAIALLVELPPQDLARALTTFARMTVPYIVLFAEYAPTEPNPPDWRAALSTDVAAPIDVHVGQLKSDDVALFAEKRTNRDDVRNHIPPLAAEVTVKLEQFLKEMSSEGKGMSIGELQRWLYYSYERALGAHPDISEISWAYLTECWFRNSQGLEPS